MRSNEPLVIEAGKTERQYWRDIVQYRELFYFLAWRDMVVRYKQTVIGIAWAILRPFLTMVIFTVIFGKIAKLPSENVPYAIMVFAGLLPWQFFSSAMTESGNSLIQNANLITKIYFPRMVIPASSVVLSFVDYLISFVIYIGLMVWYRFYPSWQVLWLPFFSLLAFLVAVGIGLWLAALNVKYRDFRYIIPFLVQIGLYVSPVGFSSSVIPPKYHLLYCLNPMVGIIDGFRWSLLGVGANLLPVSLPLSIVVTIVLLISGIRYFRSTEKRFADII